MEYNLLIVGAGQLGSRHLQALAQLDNKFNIYVLDTSEQSLSIAEQRYLEVAKEHSPRVEYISNINSIKDLDIEVCVVATSAAIRLEVVKQLSQTVSIKYLILEKVLFQSVKQLEEANELLHKKNMKTWVNCPRRQFAAYKEMANKYKDAKSVSLEVHGKNWGLGCNSIHFIDLWNYLTEFSEYTLEFQNNTKVINSKRSGYKEIIGKLIARSSDGQHRLALSCEESNDNQVSVDIFAKIDGERIELAERDGVVRWLDSDGGMSKESPLQVLFQSQLTHKVVLDLIKHDECELTPLTTSTMLHTEFLNKAAQLFISNESCGLEQLVPIT